MLKSFEKKDAGFISKIELNKPKAQIVYWGIFAVLTAVACLCFIPLVWIILSGFKDTQEFYMVPPTIIPKSFHISKFFDVWNKFSFIKPYINSIMLACGNIVSCLLFNGMAGYVLSRLKPKGYKFVYTVLLVLLMLPTSVGQVPLYMQIIDVPHLHFSMLNSYLPLWLMAGGSVYNIILFKNFFDSVSSTYIEAARLDGCSNLMIFFRIVLPLCIPIFTVMAIFTFNAAWGSFFWPSLILTDRAKYPVAEYIYKMNAATYPQDEYMLVLTVAMFPPVIVFLLFQKNIMSGISTGGIKG